MLKKEDYFKRIDSSEQNSEFIAMEAKSFARDVWERFRTNKRALAGLIGSKRLPLKKPPERGGLFLCVRKFWVQGKLEVIERPALFRTLLTEIHDLFQNTFQHIILCLCIREGIVDLK